ncbi:MAG: diheme cytochrome c-553 [Bacteroidia bacterium]|nr:diheme cytochrome c-553 [Bacteroidia bacterium]
MKKQKLSTVKQIAVCGLLMMSAQSCTTEVNNSHQKEQAKVEQPSIENQADLVKRGEYLVTLSGCNDCHSPKKMNENGMPVPDPELLLSGHLQGMELAPYDKSTVKNWVLMNMNMTAAIGPWGISYAANITSDSTGIGLWTEQQFIKAMQEGKYKGIEGSRPLLPPMPWPNYAAMSDEDLRAVFAFLQTTKPIKNNVPAYQPPLKN